MIPATEISVLDELARAIDGRFGTRTAFAKAVGIGSVYLSEILSGKKPLSRLPIETGRKIAEMSGISLDRLAGAAMAEIAVTPSLSRGEAAE